MPILILLVGLLLIIAAVNNKLPELGALIKEDFAPSEDVAGFPMWVLAIVIAGSIGYIKDLKPVSNGFLALIIIGIILSNKGFFAQFTEAVEQI